MSRPVRAWTSVLEAARAQVLADRGGAAALPDDGVVDRRARRAIPDERGLALVRDADRGDVARRDAGCPRGRCARGVELRRPDRLRVMRDPAGLRIDLREFDAPPARRRAPSRSNRIARELDVP